MYEDSGDDRKQYRRSRRERKVKYKGKQHKKGKNAKGLDYEDDFRIEAEEQEIDYLPRTK